MNLKFHFYYGLFTMPTSIYYTALACMVIKYIRTVTVYMFCSQLFFVGYSEESSVLMITLVLDYRAIGIAFGLSRYNINK